MMLRILQSTVFNNFTNLTHGTVYEENEISKTNHPVNFSYSVGENPQIIDQNYQKFSKFIGISEENIKRVKQTHSSNVVIVNDYKMPNYHYQADALITDLPNICLAITTADCLPIFIYADDKKYIANIHAGWRGAKDLIIENTITKLIDLGCDPINMKAAIMPAIDVKSYEVQKNFCDNFANNTKNFTDFIITNKNKYFFDLKKFAYDKLSKLLIKKIEIVNYDSFSTQYLFSHRDTIKNNAIVGRNLNFICLKK